MCQGLQPHLTLVFQTLQSTQSLPDLYTTGSLHTLFCFCLLCLSQRSQPASWKLCEFMSIFCLVHKGLVITLHFQHLEIWILNNSNNFSLILVPLMIKELSKYYL